MKRTKALLIFVVLICLCLTGAIGGGIQPGSTLVIDLGGDIPEVVPFSPLTSLFMEDQPVVLDKVLCLEAAARDRHIKSVVVRLTDAEYAMGKAQEFRSALLRFKQSGKPVYAYLELEGGGNLEYYIASAADKVFLSPASSLTLNGLSTFRFYLGGVWEKIYLDVQVDQIAEYKSAADMIGRKDMSDAEREVANSILDSLFARFVKDIAEGRGVSEDTVRGWIDEAFPSSDLFVGNKVVDGLAYFDEVVFREAGVDREHAVAEKAYREFVDAKQGRGKARIAVVYGVGSIVTGEEPTGPFAPSNIIASDAMVRRLIRAMEDPKVDAVLFRVDSGGGSALASDVIWRATQRVKEKKPIVVSMADVAGSGGYYISCGADAIVAQPGTITGSIGILTAHISLGKLLKKIGVGTESIGRGEFAGMGRMDRTLDDRERQKVRESIASLYDLFIGRVGQGRGLDKEKVNEIGRGRIWTGAQGQERGLVDALGGYETALGIIKERLGLAADAEVELIYKREPVSLWKILTGQMPKDASIDMLRPEERALVEALRVNGLYAPNTPLAIMPGPLTVR